MRSIVVRPARSRILVGEDLRFGTEDGAHVGDLMLRLGRPNVFRSRETGPLTLTVSGFRRPRFEARRESGARVALIEYDLLSGAMDLVVAPESGSVAPPARVRLDERGLLLPVTRLVEPGGHVSLEVEAWRLFGKEHRVTLRPEGSRWSEEELLAIAALVFHARASLAILFGAAASAGALAPARRSRRGAFERARRRVSSMIAREA